MRVFLIVIALALFSEGSTAQQKAQPPASNSQEVEVLRAQLETTNQFQERFISMVQWSLGAVVAVALGLAAFSWHSNRITYERDRDALRQELQLLKDEIRALTTEEAKRLKQEVADATAGKATELHAALDKTVDSRVTGLQSRISEVHTAVLSLQSEFVELEAENALKDKRPTWAIYKYCEYLDLVVQLKTDYYQASDALDSISQILSTPGLKLSADDVTNTVATLQRLPSKHHPVAEKLIKRIKEL